MLRNRWKLPGVPGWKIQEWDRVHSVRCGDAKRRAQRRVHAVRARERVRDVLCRRRELHPVSDRDAPQRLWMYLVRCWYFQRRRPGNELQQVRRWDLY